MSKLKLGLMAAGGCAAACAAVSVLPVLLGGAMVGGSLAALEGEAGLAVLLAVAGGAAYLWWRRREAQECACAPDQGCKAEESSCALPNQKEPS